MRNYFSLDRYKDIWKLELEARSCKPLAVIVRNWSAVRTAFEARNRLAHGRDRFTTNMAKPHVEALLKGVGYVDDYCKSLGCPLFGRMPIRWRVMSRHVNVVNKDKVSGSAPTVLTTKLSPYPTLIVRCFHIIGLSDQQPNKR